MNILPAQSEHPLCNIFAGEKADKIDDGTVSNLLSFPHEGRTRMDKFTSNKLANKKTSWKRKTLTPKQFLFMFQSHSVIRYPLLLMTLILQCMDLLQ